MKATVFDALMYLFDNYFGECQEDSPDQEFLRRALRQAGFGDNQISKAFDWLEGLVVQKEQLQSGSLASSNSMRMYSACEMEKLDRECRGFLLFLEQAGVLDGFDREVVIDRIMALEIAEISIQQLQWVIFMVLLNQPDKQAAVTWMEEIVRDDMYPGLH